MSDEKYVTMEVNEAKLEEYATKINTIKASVQKTATLAAIEIGGILRQVKAAIGHGNFGNWLKEHVDYSERTAQKLMQLWEAYGTGEQSLFGDSGNPQLVANLSVTNAIALLGIKDADERAAFIEEHDVENMSKRDLEKAIKERDEARNDAESKSEVIETLRNAMAVKDDEVSRLNDELDKAKAAQTQIVEKVPDDAAEKMKSQADEIERLRSENAELRRQGEARHDEEKKEADAKQDLIAQEKAAIAQISGGFMTLIRLIEESSGGHEEQDKIRGNAMVIINQIKMRLDKTYPI